MKKYLKSLAKKSMSLCLAVLMLLSCWVWVAPTEAEAASADDGYYQVRVFVPTFEDPDAKEHFEYDKFVIICADGSEQTITHNGGHVSSTSNYVIAEGWVNSFPTGVRHDWKQKQYQTGTDCDGNAEYGYENGYYLKTPYAEFYDNVAKIWIKFAKRDDNYATNGSGAAKSVTYDGVETTPPTAKEFRVMGDSDISIDVPYIGTEDPVSATPPTAATFDQYGVKIGTTEDYFVATDKNGSAPCSDNKEDESYCGIWYDDEDKKIYVHADVQIKLESTTGKKEVYFIASGGSTKQSIATITLKYKNYTVTVDPDGSIENLGATMDMDGGSTQTGAWSATGPYSYVKKPFPTGNASKPGYEFYGFWTIPQPKDDGNASFNAEKAVFAEPINSETFAEFCDKVKDTDGNNYVTVDGKEFYNAGVKWDSANHSVVKGELKFYGWWIPKDIVVKFYDIDGVYLGAKTAKYNSTQPATWYIPSKYKDSGYSAGAYEYETFTGKWRDITGVVVTEGEYTFAELETLTLTPIYDGKYNDGYQVNFFDPLNGGNLEDYSKEYAYRDILDSKEIPTGLANPPALSNDPRYSYEFAGWTTQEPAKDDDGNIINNYIVVSADDTSVAINEDWVVRKDVTYYAVYRSTIKEYRVAFNYRDSSGVLKTEIITVTYGSVIKTPDFVNRSYAVEGIGYTLEGWTYKQTVSRVETLDVDGTIVFNDTNVFIMSDSVINFTAAYGDGVSTPYTVTFKYKDAKGKDIVFNVEVDNGDAITQENVDKFTVPTKYNDGNAEYTFSNYWNLATDGYDESKYTTEALASFKPKSHVTFEAVYGEGIPYYTVKYIDGANIYEERVLKGSNVPAWYVDGKVYAPTKAKTDKGEYTFAGWFDEIQTDKDFGATNGTKYTLEDKVSSDITLYSQFIFSPFTFNVKFVDDDGTVLSERRYQVGESFKDIYDEAEEKASKPSDKIYSYTFIGWDRNPGNFVCPSEDIVFKALYRPGYIPYKARWYSSFDAMEDANLEMEIVGQDGLLAITSHIYNGSIYAPSVELGLQANDVFKGWFYLENDKEVEYKRGMPITDSMSFYAVIEKGQAPEEVYIVNAVINNTTSQYPIVKGDTAEVIGRPLDSYVDASDHKTFVRWYTKDENDNANTFDPTAVVTGDITVYAEFKNEAHVKDQKEFVSAPTYYKMGTVFEWCACDKEKTITRDVNNGKPLPVDRIPMLTDTVAPTGTIYLGTQGSWSSTDEVGAAATDNDPVIYYANANTDIVLTINDTAGCPDATKEDHVPCVNCVYNPAGAGKGIAVIQGIISTGVFGADTTEIAGIQTIFSDSTETLNNTANYVIRLGTYANLVDGETYIAYYYVKDKAGNVLNKNVRTAKFIYDNTAPEITIAGDNNGAKVPTYCGKAVIKGIENGATVLVNDKVVTLTTSGAAGTSHYTITEAGNYLIKVTDKAGNTAIKKIVIASGHDEIETSKAVTCTEDGFEQIVCAVCAKVIKNETIESKGHEFGEAVVVAPTCTEDGYTVEICKCGYEKKTAQTSKLNHVDTGRYVAITKAATCSVEGEKTTYCLACNAVMATETIPVDTENGHEYGIEKVLKPTCTFAGEKYQQCRICYAKKTIETIDALNHVGTGRYTRIKNPATCYSMGIETEHCKECGVETGSKDIKMIGHTLVLVKYENDGYMQYECKATGCTHSEGRTEIAIAKEYTVTFVGAGVDGKDLKITKTAGESVEKEAVTEPTKPETVEHKYTFAGWKSSSGNLVKLPVKVTKNETYTAQFTETDQVYTHLFVNEDGSEIASIVGNYNDKGKITSIIPTKPATNTDKYEFAGWIKVDAPDNEEDPFTMKGNATFKAKFTATSIKYSVIYIYGTTILESHTVNGGAGVPVYSGSTNLKKASDSNYHYEFNNKWSIEAGTEVYADTYIQPVFDAIKHQYDKGTVTTDPTCVTTGVKEFKCACGRRYTDSIPATGEHTIVDGKCTGCGYTESQKTVSIIFKGDRGTIYSTSVLPGEKVTYTSTPTKAETAQYEYTFAGWKVYGAADNTAIKQTEFIVDKDITYIAVFTETTKVYTVTYYNGGQPIKTFTKVQYGANIPGYDVTPAKPHNDKEHYDFLGWSINNGPTETLVQVTDQKVMGDTSVYAMYRTVSHTLGDIVPGTCSKAAYQKCTGCEYEYKVPGASSVAHTPDPDSIKVNDSTFDATGTKSYYCTSCKTNVTEIIPVKAYQYINIMVWNDAGEKAQYANVKLKHNGEWYDYYEDGKETVNGFVSFKVDKNLDKKLWSAYIVGGGIEGGISGTVKTATNTDTNINEFNKPAADVETPDIPQPEEPEEPECSCSCHKNTFWGMIFRFFQKIVRLFGGKDCCADARK